MNPNKYNPQNASKEEITETFTAREPQLKDILDELKKLPSGKSNQHYLLIGPRGIGKTNFLRMIYFSVKEDSNLSKHWLPVQFAEEEYSIASMRDFYEKILEVLMEEMPDPEIQQIIEEVQAEKNDDAAEQQSFAFLKKYAGIQKRNILLLVDNLDLIIGDQFKGDIEAKKLRNVLMNESFLTLIGAAPTYFSEVSDYDEPMYNFFKIINLDELTYEQVESLLLKRAEFEKNDKLASELPALRPKLKALHLLTGGSPRLILILYQLIALSELTEVKEYLQSLLDDLTPYYQSKLKSVSPQQRRIIDAMALSDRALSPTEIAELTRFDVNTVSSNLKRLVNDGYVKLQKQARRKATYYIISEQLFRIWHQMRSSRSLKNKLRFFIDFIQMWYSQDELEHVSNYLQHKFTELLSAKEMPRALKTLEHLDYIASAASDKRFCNNLHFDIVNKYIETGEFIKAEQKLTERINESLTIDDKEMVSIYFTGLGYLWSVQKEYLKALVFFDKALRNNQNNILAWVHSGIAYHDLGEYEKAITNYDKALKINPDDYQAWYNRGTALAELDRHEDAITNYGQALKINPDDYQAWNNQGNALSRLGKNKEAITNYDQALKIKPDFYEAWCNRGAALYGLGKYAEAITIFDQALKIKPDDYKAWFNRGIALGGLGKYEEAILDFRQSLQLSPENMDDIQAVMTLAYQSLSMKEVEKENLGSAKEDILKAINCYTAIKGRDLKDIIFNSVVNYNNFLISNQQTSMLKELFSILNENELNDELQQLTPFVIATKYLESGRNAEILDRLNPEMRQIVEEILKQGGKTNEQVLSSKQKKNPPKRSL